VGVIRVLAQQASVASICLLELSKPEELIGVQSACRRLGLRQAVDPSAPGAEERTESRGADRQPLERTNFPRLIPCAAVESGSKLRDGVWSEDGCSFVIESAPFGWVGPGGATLRRVL
jgi:hypothetical protein